MNQYFMPIYTTLVGALIGFLIASLKGLIGKAKEAKQKEDIFYFDPKTGAMVTGKAKTAIKLNFDKNGACTTLKGG